MANERPDLTAALGQVEAKQEEWWNSLTKDQQLDAFCCVVRRIHAGAHVAQGSYRFVLYEVFDFGPEAYIPAQHSGYLDLHNVIREAGDE